MSGLRRAMPFTYAAFLIGGARARRLPRHVRLLLEGRDPRLRGRSAAAATGSSTSSARSARSLTAFYAFRMIFRVFWGEPNDEARELEQRPPRPWRAGQPATGEPEDTDVGFPGPEHHIAEREPAMRLPMALLAILGDRRRRRADPGGHPRDRELPRADLRGLALRATSSRRRGIDVLALAVGAA